MNSANWGQQVLKSYLHNAKIIYKREHKKLLNEIEKHGRKIYDLVIAAYYASYTPRYYDRHYNTPGSHPGFNLYRANNFEIRDGEHDKGFEYNFDNQVYNLLPYYSFWQSKVYDANKGLEQRGWNRRTVFMMVLNGERKFPQWSKDKKGRVRKDFDGNPLFVVRTKHYKFHIPYPEIRKTFTGKPHEIFTKAADHLVLYYNREIVKRIRDGINEMPIKWVK